MFQQQLFVLLHCDEWDRVVALPFAVCPFYFGHGIVCPPSIYGFWLPLWYRQTFHIDNYIYVVDFMEMLLQLFQDVKFNLIGRDLLDVLKGYSMKMVK
jgi:hypothetical protein